MISLAGLKENPFPLAGEVCAQWLSGGQCRSHQRSDHVAVAVPSVWRTARLPGSLSYGGSFGSKGLLAPIRHAPPVQTDGRLHAKAW
jgi:hypothetical protein